MDTKDVGVCVCVYAMEYTHTMEYVCVIKKNEIMPFAATWIDLEIIILSEISHRQTNIIWYHLDMKSRK